MVNGTLLRCLAVLLLAAAVLTLAAARRSAEYDEQYTLFLTAGVARPVWPDAVFTAGEVRALQAGHATLGAIARDLRTTDVHPPLYFWAVALWRRAVGDGLLVARWFSVLCGLVALIAVGAVARRVAVPPALAMLLTLGCYGFAYTGTVARGFMLAQALSLWGVAALLSADGRLRRAWACGLLLGAATFANYLAAFVGAAAIGMAGLGLATHAGSRAAGRFVAAEIRRIMTADRCHSSWRGLAPPTTTFAWQVKTWMAGPRPAMTREVAARGVAC